MAGRNLGNNDNDGSDRSKATVSKSSVRQGLVELFGEQMALTILHRLGNDEALEDNPKLLAEKLEALFGAQTARVILKHIRSNNNGAPRS